MRLIIGIASTLYFATRIWSDISMVLNTQQEVTIPILVLVGVKLLCCIVSIAFAVRG